MTTSSNDISPDKHCVGFYVALPLRLEHLQPLLLVLLLRHPPDLLPVERQLRLRALLVLLPRLLHVIGEEELFVRSCRLDRLSPGDSKNEEEKSGK